MNRTFREQANIGHARYVVSFHDGTRTHADGSPFFDIRLFNNKSKKQKFISGLVASGYRDDAFGGLDDYENSVVPIDHD